MCSSVTLVSVLSWEVYLWMAYATLLGPQQKPNAYDCNYMNANDMIEMTEIFGVHCCYISTVLLFLKVCTCKKVTTIHTALQPQVFTTVNLNCTSNFDKHACYNYFVRFCNEAENMLCQFRLLDIIYPSYAV